jgi:hypothetical protein
VPETVRLRPAALEWRMVEGEVVALDVARSEYVLINRSGTALWDLLAEGSTPARLVERLVDRYGLPPEAAAADVDAFLGVLADRQLLESA